MLPLVSIVTPVLNGGRFLAENLASVRGQDYPRLEHIVVDGGSTDRTLEILRHAPGIAPDLKVQRALNLDGGSSSAFWFAGERGAFSIPEQKSVRDFVAVVPK